MFSKIIGTWLNSLDSSKQKQSPINIITSLALYDKNLAENEVILNYDQNCFKEIKNNGYTFVISGITSSWGYGWFPLNNNKKIRWLL